MKRMLLFCVIVLFTFLFIAKDDIHASQNEEINPDEGTGLDEELMEELNLEEINRYWIDIQDMYGAYLPENYHKSIKQFVNKQEGFSLTENIKGIIQFLLFEIIENGNLLGTLLMLTIFSKLLQSIHPSFEQSTVSKVAYFIVYIVLIYIALNSFYLVFSYARETVLSMSGFMIALLPLLLGLMASFGQVISVAFFHPIIIFLIHLSGLMMTYFVFPLLYLSALLLIIGQLNTHFNVNQLADLFKTISLGVLGIFLSVFLGIISIQGTASAVQDGVALKTTKFVTGNFIPVVGRTFTEAADTVLSALLLLKNTIGIIGLMIILFIVLFPAIKILVISLIYKLCAALLQPLGNSPVIKSLTIVSKYTMYVLACVITMAFMFFLSIVIMIIASNIPLLIR